MVDQYYIAQLKLDLDVAKDDFDLARAAWQKAKDRFEEYQSESFARTFIHASWRMTAAKTDVMDVENLLARVMAKEGV